MVAVPLKEGLSAKSCCSNDGNHARRLLALAAIAGQAAAGVGGLDRQTLRDGVYAFNKFDLHGLLNDTSVGALASPRRGRRQR
jgi:hypothetical protein